MRGVSLRLDYVHSLRLDYVHSLRLDDVHSLRLDYVHSLRLDYVHSKGFPLTSPGQTSHRVSLRIPKIACA